MLFAGFGFLMTFLKNYGYSALGFTIIITASITEFAILCFGWSRLGPGEYTINITMIESEHCMQCVLCIELYCRVLEGGLAAATVLISFGVLIGKVEFYIYCTVILLC